jgi:hypothetical protein
MNLGLGFALSLLVTVALLALVVVTGIRRKRSAHYVGVTAFFVSLGASIWLARAFGASGGGLHFEAARTTQLLHRIAIGVTFVLVLPLVVSGFRLAKAKGPTEPARRKSHHGLAIAFVVMFLLTSALGAVMTWQALAATG